MPNLRSTEGYEAGLWDWTFLNPCFSPTPIRLSDIDGVVERKGAVLFIETKRPGEELTRGQQYLYSTLDHKDDQLVLIVWGHPQQPIEMQLFHRQPFPVETDTERLQDYIRRWFLWADDDNRNPRDRKFPVPS